MSIRDALKLKDHQVTDEAIYHRRRELLGLMAAMPALALSGCSQAQPPAAPGAAICTIFS